MVAMWIWLKGKFSSKSRAGSLISFSKDEMDNTSGKLQNLFMILDAVKDLKAEEATGREVKMMQCPSRLKLEQVLYAYPAGETQQSKAGLFLGMRDIVWDFASQAVGVARGCLLKIIRFAQSAFNRLKDRLSVSLTSSCVGVC